MAFANQNAWTQCNFYNEMDWFFSFKTTTKKYDKFVAEPMRNKPVTELPGIGPVLGGRLKEKGFCEARQVYDMFIKLNQNRDAFQRWLGTMCNANCKQSEDCFLALKGYSDTFICA